MTDEGTTCLAQDVATTVADWEEWELFVPGLMTGGSMDSPEFEDDWLPVDRLSDAGGRITFGIAHGYISHAPTDEIRVRLGR